MVVKAKLKVVLQADDVVIAESEDSALWQRVLRAIHAPSSSAADVFSEDHPETLDRPPKPPDASTDSVAGFARWIGVKLEKLEGACSPTLDSPFLQLDPHCWEAFRKGLPERGRNAIGPMQLAGTLLALWFRHARLGNPTQAQGQAVLDTIGVTDKNPSRAIRNCEWLQLRNGNFQVNPAMISRAIEVARAYCSRTPLVSATEERSDEAQGS